jgi:hypothetical protein
MSFSVEFPLETERRVLVEAGRLNLAPEEYVRRVVERALPIRPLPTTGADLIAQWRRAGVIGAWAERGISDSVAYAQSLRRSAQARPVR